MISCTSSRKLRYNKIGEDPIQMLIDSTGINVEQWGWIMNEINSYILLENGFPDMSNIRIFIETYLIVYLSVQDNTTNLNKKVSMQDCSKYSLYD